jgi:hypothetical protein
LSFFSHRRYLQTHINFVHLKEENARQCPHCEFRTPSHTALRLHVRSVHEGLKNFVCQFCGKACSQKVNEDANVFLEETVLRVPPAG